MASPSRGPLPNVYDMLDDLYLSLWTQIDYLIGEDKWLDLEPADPSGVAADAQREMAQIEAQFEGERELITAREDYRGAQTLITSTLAALGRLPRQRKPSWKNSWAACNHGVTATANWPARLDSFDDHAEFLLLQIPDERLIPVGICLFCIYSRRADVRHINAPNLRPVHFDRCCANLAFQLPKQPPVSWPDHLLYGLEELIAHCRDLGVIGVAQLHGPVESEIQP